MTGCGRETSRASAILLLSLLSATLLAGCLNEGQVDRSVEASKAGTSGARGVPESTVGASRVKGDLAGTVDTASGDPFVGGTEESGGSGYDADTVLGVRYGDHEYYERAVIDLGTGREPATTVSRWTLTSTRGGGLLRVNLPSASATCVSDGTFGEGLLGSFYVVRAPDGGMFLDFFARKAFLYRVLELRDPARLVVDFKPTGEDLNAPLPAESGNTVLLEPSPKAPISDPLTASGYSRNPEAVNTITLTGPNEEVLVRRTVRSNDWSHTWGYYEATLDLPPLSGRATLKVGAASARDGSFEGVEIPVRAGP